MPENAMDALLKTILDAGITFEDMDAANEGHWLQISALAEVNIPSAKTRSAVLARLYEVHA
jgi:hypothetical protein